MPDVNNNSQKVFDVEKHNNERVTYLALLHGIAAIQNQKSLSAAVGDRDLHRMCAVVRSMGNPADSWALIGLVEERVGHEIDLWPDHAAVTPEDGAKREQLMERLASHRRDRIKEAAKKNR
ncbi:hypothetical protein VW23_008600 [Devosia insulae DS-56]|uniref:Uncharacterized protein n=1 Tax=Devosia insulae DS-56 TaxID=1116389 RepID=A0A1E5XWT7_9HYPH|nr:hypothetical protein [Devosia insulae]OEO33057.1 hypothetical protein VW23_008600 [Devosia insulae DS-56]